MCRRFGRVPFITSDPLPFTLYFFLYLFNSLLLIFYFQEKGPFGGGLLAGKGAVGRIVYVEGPMVFSDFMLYSHTDEKLFMY